MKKLCLTLLAISLLAGCSDDLKESKVESKKVADKIEEVKKEEPKKKYVPDVYVQKPIPEPEQPELQSTQNESDYLDVFEESINAFHETMGEVYSLIDEADSNPALLSDDAWGEKVKSNFREVTTLKNLFIKMNATNNVPERFKALNQYAINTFELMSMAGEMMRQNIDSESGFQQSVADESENFIMRSNNELKKVNAEINRITTDVSSS